MNAAKMQTITKPARIHDKATGTYLEVLEFPVSDVENNRLELPPSIVADPKALENKLRDAGAILPSDDAERRELLASMAKTLAPDDLVYDAQTGWTDDRKAFVLIDGVIGVSAAKIIGVNRSNAVSDGSGRLATKGKLSAWRDTVANPARHSTTLMFAICAALGAPLLTIVNRQSFTINLFGRSRMGKSVATLAGASVIGTPRTDDLITWNITDARLEQRLAESNDALFPIDDLSTIHGKDGEKYQRIRGLAYKIAAGWATGRHDSFTSAHEGAHRDWHCIVLTSSEKSIRDLANAVKQERQHGEALRLIDVPAAMDGQDHIFDRLPPDITPSSFTAWKNATFAGISEGCLQNHGVAWRAYIKGLLQHPSLKDYVEKRILFFEKHVCDEYDGDVARDVARKFGLIYAGGMLGIAFELLPWEKSELLAAVSESYVRARDLLPDDGILLRVGIAALREKLLQLPRISTPPNSKDAKRKYDEMSGYRQRTETANRYVIKGEAFNQIFSTAKQQDLVIQRLIEKKRITLATPQQSEGLLVRNPKEQHIWPDGKRRRSFEIVWRHKKEKTKKKAAAKKAR